MKLIYERDDEKEKKDLNIFCCWRCFHSAIKLKKDLYSHLIIDAVSQWKLIYE